MSRAEPLWGAPRIHGELLKLGIEVSETSIGKYMLRHRKPPTQTWRTFLENHISQLVSVDFFTVPTIRFQVHPTAEWSAQQLRNALPLELGTPLSVTRPDFSTSTLVEQRHVSCESCHLLKNYSSHFAFSTPQPTELAAKRLPLHTATHDAVDLPKMV
jgi:hypothetical protein